MLLPGTLVYCTVQIIVQNNALFLQDIDLTIYILTSSIWPTGTGFLKQELNTERKHFHKSVFALMKHPLEILFAPLGVDMCAELEQIRVRDNNTVKRLRAAI